ARAYRKAVKRSEMDIARTEKEIENALRVDTLQEPLLATLSGRKLLHLMRTQKVVIGRSTPKNRVDVDLLCETHSLRVPRRAAVLSFQQDGNFHLRNVSSKAILVNGFPVLPRAKHRLPLDASLIEIGGVLILFSVHMPMWHQIQQQLD
ncbi:MAG: FHA domain-containing protein, partial [archaeon]|nr:FHA domain-containing protein [archaeon]